MKKVLYVLVVLSLFSCEKEDEDENYLYLLRGNWELISTYCHYYYSEAGMYEYETIIFDNDTLLYQYYSPFSFLNDTNIEKNDTLLYNLKLLINETAEVHCYIKNVVTNEVKMESYFGSYYEDEHTTHLLHGETFQM